jgi:hypothetical protein
MENQLFRSDRISDNLLASLDNRDAGLWVRSLPANTHSRALLTELLGLPWKVVLSEEFAPTLFDTLESEAALDTPLVRKRGFIQLIDSDPSRVDFPQRCLPIYLLNGRHVGPPLTDFESRLHRITMLEQLRRSGIRQLVIISTREDPMPPDLSDLWTSGFKSSLTFISDVSTADVFLDQWLNRVGAGASASLLTLSVDEAFSQILARYNESYPEERQVIRVRDVHGALHKVDVTESDEPERPIADWYSLIEERDLGPVTPEELSEDDFVAFFRDSTSSWRPYAAGLPWVRDPLCGRNLISILRKLDASGSDENCITYISSESGAGGTTLARTLAWECAREGYPVLLAKQVPFVPNALPVVNYLNRVHGAISSRVARGGKSEPSPRKPEHEATTRLYQTPWLIVFDTLHWQYREGDLVRFLNEVEKSGRPACLLVVTGPALEQTFLNGSRVTSLGELNHAIQKEETRQLGEHLNKFLRRYGKQRAQSQWDRYYEDHTVRYLEGTAAFWVTLSFWIQGQYDLSESIQEWIYRSYKRNATEPVLREAILRIAAMSTERLPLPEILLPPSRGGWPVSHLLADARGDLAALGLVRHSSGGDRYWALIHDVLGRFLINAIFYDYPMRSELGLSTARDPEHLRYLVLRQISREPVLGERAYRDIGEEFATSIFKIDPDHGHSNFVSIWREVLYALDAMPRPLRDTSRLFRHHIAISRRRIAKLGEQFYGVTQAEKLTLLYGAIMDIKYALENIEYTAGSESNLNLYNSLANAYFDLADAEAERGATAERITEIRRLANDATRRAYEENATNSFVIETYVRNLIQSADGSSPLAIEQCVEALNIVFSALSSNQTAYRASQLGDLADRALNLLLKKTPPEFDEAEPSSPIDMIVSAWKLLAKDRQTQLMSFGDIAEGSRIHALELLEHPVGRGSMQVIRLRYDLTCATYPFEYKQQLELAEQLQATNYRITPQLKLEYAILLFQNARFLEGDRVFRSLRQLWRENEYFVEVPERLRWLRGADGVTLKTVHALIEADSAIRAMARVREFNSIPVPFRPEEHDLRVLKAGTRLTCHVSFGHNGPFLRPVTAVARG